MSKHKSEILMVKIRLRFPQAVIRRIFFYKKPVKWHSNESFLKSGSYLPKELVLFASFQSPLKMMNNAFYFILKAFLVLKILKFL